MTRRLIIVFIILAAACFAFKSPARAEITYDLKAESLIMSSAKCEINQACAFTARVKNLGTGFVLNFPIKSTVSAAGYRTDSPTTVSPVQGAAVNTNDYLTFYLYGVFTQIGSITLNFSVDPAGYLSESNTGNNSVSLTVSVAGYDLSVESFSLWPASPAVGQTCYILARVKNNSSYKLYTGAGLNLFKVFPDFTVGQASSTEPSLSRVIDSGGFLYYGYEGKFTAAGEKQLSFTIDPDDVLRESNSANNLKTLKTTVYNPAETDLALESVSFSADKIVLGSPLDITVGLKNIGKISLTSAFGFSKAEFNFTAPYFDYGVNDLTPDAYPALTAPLNPGEVFHYKLHGAFNQPGNFNLAFSFNKDKQLTEANYGNNATTTAVMVYKNQTEADSFSLLSRSVSFISSTTAVVKWRTDVKTTGSLNYGLSGYDISQNKKEDNNSALEHSITLDKLAPGGNYVYFITVKSGRLEKIDTLNNFSQPENDFLKFTSPLVKTITDRKIVFNWATNLVSSGRIYYKKKTATALAAAGSEALTASHEIGLTNLDYGWYDYFLSSTSTPLTNFKTDWAEFEIKAAPAAATSTPVAAAPAISPAPAAVSLNAVNDSLYQGLKGKIILKVESNGEAYYLSSKEKKIYYLGRPADALEIIRAQGLGITNVNFAKIPLGLGVLSGADADQDGLPDALEQAIGTDENKTDTDGDGYGDKSELAAGYSPLLKAVKMNYDNSFAAGQKGKIFLQVESLGQAWYINPNDGKRYFLSRPADAFNLMRRLGVGVSNGNFDKLAK